MFGFSKNVIKKDIIKSISNLKPNYLEEKERGEQEDEGDEESEQEENKEGVEGERNNLKKLSHLELS